MKIKDVFDKAVDMVNKPPHYADRKIEVIDVMEDTMTHEGYKGYLEGAIIKYIMRFKVKENPLQDLKKARWYLDQLIKKLEQEGK